MERGALNNASSPVDVVSTSASALGESPLWHPGLRCLLWVDIVGKRLHRLDPASGDESHWTLPEEPGCIGLVAAAADGPGRATPSDIQADQHGRIRRAAPDRAGAGPTVEQRGEAAHRRLGPLGGRQVDAIR